MIDIVDFRECVVEPVLEYLEPHIQYSQSAINIILLTTIAESELYKLRQYSGGPARGFIQMEPGTEQSIWDNFLKFRSELKHKIKKLHLSTLSREANLAGNLHYQVAMCRLQYWPVPEKLPTIDDSAGMASYYKRFYNTALGKAKESEIEATYIKYFM